MGKLEKIMSASFSRNIILTASLFMKFSSIMYAIGGDNEKWFSRLFLSLILFSTYGIMIHIDNLRKDLKPKDEWSKEN